MRAVEDVLGGYDARCGSWAFPGTTESDLRKCISFGDSSQTMEVPAERGNQLAYDLGSEPAFAGKVLKSSARAEDSLFVALRLFERGSIVMGCDRRSARADSYSDRWTVCREAAKTRQLVLTASMIGPLPSSKRLRARRTTRLLHRAIFGGEPATDYFDDHQDN